MKNILFVVALTLVSLCISAQEQVNSIRESGDLIVGTTGKQPPFSYHDENDSLVGFDLELAHELAHAMEAELEVREYPFEKLISALKNGEVDVVISALSIKVYRNMDVMMVGPYYNCKKAILTLKGGPNADQGGLNHEKIRLALIQNSTSEGMAGIYYPKATIVYGDNAQHCFNMLEQGEVDAVLGDYESLINYPNAIEKAEVKFIEDVPVYDPLSIAIRPGDPLFLNLIENFVHSVRASGFIDDLEMKYGLSK